MSEYTEQVSKKGKGIGGFFSSLSVSIEYLSVTFVDSLLNNLSIMKREVDLFLGSTLTLLGLFNWSSGKYCDGNTADYLSCTRPVTYYYYGTLEIALLIVGVSLLLLWIVKNKAAK